MACAKAGFHSDIALERREDHDLLLGIDFRPQGVPVPTFSFTNAWPEDGFVRSGQTLRLRYVAEGMNSLAPPVSLDMVSGLDTLGAVMRTPWDGSALDWSFPYPLRDTLTFRLRALIRDDLNTMRPCQVPAISPPLASDSLRGRHRGRRLRAE